MKTLVALLALLALFGSVGVLGLALSVGPCAGTHQGHRTRPGAAETRAEAVKALIDGLRRAPGGRADDHSPGSDEVGVLLLFDDSGTSRGTGTARPVGVSGKWEVRARDCRTGREWRFLLLEAEGGEAVVVLRQ